MPNAAYRAEASELGVLLQRSAQERAIAEVEARMRVESKLDSFIVETKGNFDRVDDRFGRLDDKFDEFKKETKENFIRIDDKFERLDDKFERLDDKFDNFKKWVIGMFITMMLGFIGVLAAIFAQQVF